MRVSRLEREAIWSVWILRSMMISYRMVGVCFIFILILIRVWEWRCLIPLPWVEAESRCLSVGCSEVSSSSRFETGIRIGMEMPRLSRLLKVQVQVQGVEIFEGCEWEGRQEGGKGRQATDIPRRGAAPPRFQHACCATGWRHPPASRGMGWSGLSRKGSGCCHSNLQYNVHPMDVFYAASSVVQTLTYDT